MSDGLQRRRSRAQLSVGRQIIVILGLLLVVIVVMAVVRFVTTPSSNGEAPPAEPSIVSSAEADVLWAQITEDYPGTLPDGIGFPAAAPAFFHPSGSETNGFEDSIVWMFVADYWRCAWLDSAVAASDAQDEQALSDIRVELEQYAALPKVAESVDVEAQNADRDVYAQELGVTPERAEFDLNCAFYQEEVEGMNS